MRAKDNDHYKSGNHTPKHPLQVFPLKTYLPSTFNAQMCALSRQTARTKREKEGGRKNYLNIDVWPLSTVSLAWNVQPGLPAAVAAVSLCARRACKFVQLDAKTNTWNASRSNGHTVYGHLRHFFVNFILFFCIQSKTRLGQESRVRILIYSTMTTAFILYMQLLLYFRLGPTLYLQFSSFLSHKKCKCVLATK